MEDACFYCIIFHMVLPWDGNLVAVDDETAVDIFNF